MGESLSGIGEAARPSLVESLPHCRIEVNHGFSNRLVGKSWWVAGSTARVRQSIPPPRGRGRWFRETHARDRSDPLAGLEARIAPGTHWPSSTIFGRRCPSGREFRRQLTVLATPRTPRAPPPGCRCTAEAPRRRSRAVPTRADLRAGPHRLLLKRGAPHGERRERDCRERRPDLADDRVEHRVADPEVGARGAIVSITFLNSAMCSLTTGLASPIGVQHEQELGACFRTRIAALRKSSNYVEETSWGNGGFVDEYRRLGPQARRAPECCP